MLLAALLFAAATAGSDGASAITDSGIPVTIRKTCPIGGRAFDFQTTASYSTFGARPDGKPYGSWTFPLALPECPDNGLILYKADFSADELTRLGALIQRPDYAAMRGSETSYYRLAWLLREMGEPVEGQLWMLAQATWQDDPGSERRNRYLADLAERTRAASLGVATASGIAWRARSVNALRELSRFDQAAAMLAETRVGEPPENADEDERENWIGWKGQLDVLRRLVERRDASAEPLDAVPESNGVAQCVVRATNLTTWERSWCEARRDEVARMREQIER